MTVKNVFAGLKKGGGKKPGKKKIAVIAGVLVVCTAAGIFAVRHKKASAGGDEITTAEAKKGSISVVISGTGTVEANDQYDITSLTEGEIISDYFEEGDVVEKGALLYSIDTSDIQNNISKSQLSVDNASSNYQSALEDAANLNVKSPVSGTVTKVYVKVGDNVTAGGKIADVIDNGTMKLIVPFIAEDAASLHTGQSVSVKLDSSFYETTGTITKITSGEIINSYGAAVKNVVISVNNPGSIKEGDTATAVAGGVAGSDSGTFEYNASETITAEVGGKVNSLNITAGDKISKSAVAVQLTSDSVSKSVKERSNSLKDAKLSLENQYDNLEDYSIKAPISGTVLQKNYKAGDKIDRSSNSDSKALAVIADLSRLLFTMNVDELDVSKIQVGQEVDITVDAIEDVTYTGYVDYVSLIGTSTNGVTSYPVTIVINEPDNIIPGMNVSANIVVESKVDILTVPVSAVQRGNMVFVKSDDKTAKTDEKQADGEEKTDGKTDGKPKMNAAPDGFKAVKVETGINDDNNIEIVSGLSEGDVVFVTPTADSSSDNNMMMPGGGMPGGMGGGPGGGGPGGGTGGGMR